MIAARNPLAAAVTAPDAPLAAPGAPAPSPLLVAMVAEWEAVGRRMNDPLNEDGPEFEALGDWHDNLQRAIYLFPAGSVLDLLAKAPVFRDEARDAVGGLAEGLDPKDTLAGAAWHGLLRDFERLAGCVGQAAPAAPIPHDPILSRISETRAALGRALAVLADHRRDTPGADLPPLWFEASDMAQDAFRRALAVPPTTDAGRRALARLTLDLRRGLDEDFREDITAVLQAVAGEAAAPEPSLADQIVACWREWSLITDPGKEEDDPVALKRIGDRRNALLDAAEQLPAVPENVPVKALALAWLEYVALWENGLPREGYAIDGRLALDVDTAITGRLATRA